MNKANKNNKAKYICLLCRQPYEEPPSENCIKCAKYLQWCHNRCSDYAGKEFFGCNFLSCLINFEIAMSA